MHSGHAAQMRAPCDILGAQTVLLGLFGVRIEAEGEAQWEISMAGVPYATRLGRSFLA